MDILTPTPEKPHSVKRLIGAIIIGVGGMLLLNQLMTELSPPTTADQDRNLRPTEHRNLPATRTPRVVEV